MNFAADEAFLENARALEPLIRAHSDEADRQRRLPRPVIDGLARAGLFRMLTPRSLGGLELDPVTCARAIEEIAGFDSAAGWSLMTGNSADWWCCRLPDEGAEELYEGDADAVLAAAFHPPQAAVRSNGGYRVNGRGPLASNIHDANWLMMTAQVQNGGADAPAIALFARAGEAEIIDTWYTLGMRGSDSNDVALHDVFVPQSRTFPLVPDFKPGKHYQGPLYRIPGMGEVGAVGPPVALGIAREAIREFRELAQSKTSFGSAKVLRERTTAQTRLAEAEAILRSARAFLYQSLSEAWQRALDGQPPTLEQRADLLLASAHAMSSAVKAVDLIYSVSGTSAIYDRSRIERHFRDIHVLRHHGFMSESRYEAVGQVYLGVPPEFGMVQF